MDQKNEAGESTFSGRNYARSLDFTDEQYEEASKRIKSPNDANQLLVALLEVSYQNQPDTTRGMQCDLQPGNTSPTSAGTSGYSSTTSFATPSTASSSNQSLESLAVHQHAITSQSRIEGSHTVVTALNQDPECLRRIYVDGSNVARTHGKNGQFSWLGIKICVDWFHCRGHKAKVLVPMDKCHQASSNHIDASVLAYLRQIDVLIETPTGCNDDMFIIEAARQKGGIIVSNDLFRDERHRFGSTENLDQFIHFNRLPYVFDDDLFIPASDPRGRSGPKLEEFLRINRQQNLDYNQNFNARRPQARRSMPERTIKRPSFNQEPPVGRLIPIIQRSQKQTFGPDGEQSLAHTRHHTINRTPSGSNQETVTRMRLTGTKSHNF